MSNTKKLIREKFRDAVFERDGHRCCACVADPDHAAFLYFDKSVVLDAHHITDRNEMPNGGYVVENGISLCPVHHERAEVFHRTGVADVGFKPEDLYVMIGSSYQKAVKASMRIK